MLALLLILLPAVVLAAFYGLYEGDHEIKRDWPDMAFFDAEDLSDEEYHSLADEYARDV